MRSPAFHRDPYARELAVTVRPELVDGQPAAWLADTIVSAIVGLIVGFIIVGIMHLIPRRKKSHGATPVH